MVVACSCIVLAAVSVASIAATVKPKPTSLFENLQGVRWKPKLGARDQVLSKVPYSGGATKQAAADLVKNYAEYSTIDVTPAKKLLKNGYSEEEAAEWKQQQYTAIADFVEQVDDSHVRFFLHARVNSRSEFVDDMVHTIEAIQAKGLDDRIQGIMIGEHGKKDPDKYLPLALDIADEINGRTGNWLKNGKALTLHGGYLGARFAGIESAVETIDFFAEIEKRTSEFSFAFKFFDPNLVLKPRSGDLTDVKVWNQFYNEELGLGELKHMLDAHRKSYPDYAHCIFVGDAADGLYTIHRTNNEEVTIAALRDLFRKNGWTGFIFGEPFDYRDISENSERGMWKVENGDFVEQEPLNWWLEWQKGMHIKSSK
jgi:hypothetical protein